MSTTKDDTIPLGGTPSVTDTAGFDRGTGTGEPAGPVAHNLRLMKRGDDGYNERDWDVSLYQLQHPDVVVHQIGTPVTQGVAAHLADMSRWVSSFPDMRVHNNPYDIQFGQGEWTVAIGKLSGTFTEPLTLPDGTVVPPTGKPFTTSFTTIARWQTAGRAAGTVVAVAGDCRSRVRVPTAALSAGR